METNELIKKIDENFSILDLSKFFNKSVSSIRYHIKKHNLKTNGYKKIHTWEEENLINAINKSECKSDILRNLNITTKSGNFQTLDRYCLKYNIDISDLIYKNNRGNKFKKILDNENLFIEGSNVGGVTVKRRVIQENLLDYKCVKCENTGEWMGEKISLQLDHINGINNDNRLENLRFLCPNCHSQTVTYGGKNKK